MLLGLSASLRILVVVHCFRGEDESIWIVSARKATRPERAQYERGWICWSVGTSATS
ncbi:MAG: BrnT family toxin [Candidatus Tectomicrobia bacterium]|uniref:BrnT family toxin n=1 Tax=Tectimicrobiota bacterium TaxID=2528274 RepID=A0A932GPT4_UNCTE|nr:BrnT family toxin [Candidatus Tectomicrobia bacterium]